MIPQKHVYLDTCLLPCQAGTTIEAAIVAIQAGAEFSPYNAMDRSRHISEGPTAFYVRSTPC